MCCVLFFYSVTFSSYNTFYDHLLKLEAMTDLHIISDMLKFYLNI